MEGPGFDSQVQGSVVGAGGAVGAKDDGQFGSPKLFQRKEFPPEPRVAGGAVNHKTTAGLEPLQVILAQTITVSNQRTRRQSIETVGKGTGNPAIGQERPQGPAAGLKKLGFFGRLGPVGRKGKVKSGGEVGAFPVEVGGGTVRSMRGDGGAPITAGVAGEPSRQPFHLFFRLWIPVEIHEFQRPPNSRQGAGQTGQGAGVGKNGEDGGGAGFGGRAGGFQDRCGAGGGMQAGKQSKDLSEPFGKRKTWGDFSVERREFQMGVQVEKAGSQGETGQFENLFSR